jgi:hypothetical protein
MPQSPTPIQLGLLTGGFAVIAFGFTQVQRLCDYKSKAVGRVLLAVAIVLTIFWVYYALLWIAGIDCVALVNDHPGLPWVILGAALCEVVHWGIWITKNRRSLVPPYGLDGIIRQLEGKSESALAGAPQLEVEYFTNAGQFLRIKNNSEFDATYLSLGGISWTENRVIHKPGMPHEVKARQQIEFQIGVGTEMKGDDWLNTLVERQVPASASAMVTLSCRDAAGERQFERDYRLMVHNNHRLVWQPSKVRLPRSSRDPRA